MQIERDHAAENTQSAQEILTELRETYEAKKAEAEPFRQRRRELREAAKQTSENFKCGQLRDRLSGCDGGQYYHAGGC